MIAEGQSIKIFFSYASSSKDEELLTELEKHLATLKRDHHIVAWDKRNISAGNDWQQEIDSNLDSAHIILLLVSADFIASDYCQSIEMERAMERHTLGEARVIPVILRPADWRTTPFGRLQALPKDARPIVERRPQAAAFLEVAMGIRKVVEELRKGIGAPISPLPAGEYVEKKIRESAMVQFLGQQLGNYRLIRLLGQGGFADVYLGEHLHLQDKRVAIKVLRTQPTDDIVRKFKAEANTIAKLKHPNIVEVLDFGQKQDILYLVMKFAPYGSLRYPKGTRLPPDTIAPYVKQVAEALQHAHNQKVIHRDVKPENMLVGSENQVLLSDFGIAVEFKTRSEMQQDFAGTMAYMAPEQIQGRPSRKSDQYSLAVVVYEWLRGSLPFKGTYVEISAQHLNAPPPPLEMISTETQNVLMKALAKNPDKRYETVLEFANAFEQASKAPMVIATPPPKEDKVLPSNEELTANDRPAEKALILDKQGTLPSTGGGHMQISRRFTRRQTLLLLTGVGTAAGVGILYAGFAVLPRFLPQSQTPTPNTTSKPSPTVTHHPATPSPTPPPLPNAFYISRHHTNEIDAVAWSPTDNLIASGSRDKTVDVWNPTTNNYLTYHDHSDWVFSVAWSPDGTRIASASADLTVRIWSPVTGITSNLYSGHSGAVHGVAWSPDGKLIASASDDRTVQVWSAKGANPLVTYGDHNAGVDAVAWSPDGTRIASASKDKTVQVWNATTGERIFTYPGHTAEVDAVMWSPDGTRIASGSYDKTAQVWDATTEKLIHSYTEHTDTVRWVAWSPNGKFIASASADRTVRVWDATTGQKSFTYHGHSNWVHCVVWSPDGTHIASSSADKTIQVWGVVQPH